MRVLVISERKGRKSKRKTRKKRERKKVNTVLLHMCVCEKKSNSKAKYDEPRECMCVLRVNG